MNRQDVENALPVLKRLGAPLYIHAELVDMIAPKVRLAPVWAGPTRGRTSHACMLEHRNTCCRLVLPANSCQPAPQSPLQCCPLTWTASSSSS